ESLLKDVEPPEVQQVAFRMTLQFEEVIGDARIDHVDRNVRERPPQQLRRRCGGRAEPPSTAEHRALEPTKDRADRPTPPLPGGRTGQVVYGDSDGSTTRNEEGSVSREVEDCHIVARR